MDVSYSTHESNDFNTFWNSDVQLGTRHTCCVYLLYSGEIRGYIEGKQWKFSLRKFSKFC